MYGTKNFPFKVSISQTHLHEKTPHKSHAYAVRIQCRGFLISRCGPSFYECPRAIFIEKLFVSWLMLYVHTDGFHLLCFPHSNFNANIFKSIPWSKIIFNGVCIATAKNFTPASPIQTLPFALSIAAATGCISSFPFQARASKENKGIFTIIFSIFRTKLWHG